MSYRPVCVKCGIEFKTKKNGVVAQEHTEPQPTGTPYKIWNGDLWECPQCLTQIIVGWGDKPVSYHNDPDFKEYQKLVEINFY